MLRRVQTVDHSVLIRNLLLRMLIAVLPWTTALLAEYLREDDGQHLAAAICGGSLLAMALSFFAMQRYLLVAKPELVAASLGPAERAAVMRRNMIGLVPYLIADRAAHQRGLDDAAVLERAGEVGALEPLQARPQPDVHRGRVLRLQAGHLLEQARDGERLPLQQALPREEGSVECAWRQIERQRRLGRGRVRRGGTSVVSTATCAVEVTFVAVRRLVRPGGSRPRGVRRARRGGAPRGPARRRRARPRRTRPAAGPPGRARASRAGRPRRSRGGG